MTKNEAYSFFNVKLNEKIVTLFPGSRRTELKNHLPLIIESVEKIREKEPHTQFLLALAPHFNACDISLPPHIKIIQNNLYDLLSITDAAIAVSGTITLEIGLMGVPLCVIYRSSALSIWIAKKLVKTPYIALCNIVSEKCVAKELIQEEATADAISNEIITLLNNENYHRQMQNDLLLIKDKIENKEGVEKFAKEILLHT